MRHVEYGRNSYCDELFDLPPRSYSHFPPRFYYRASPRTSARAFPQFSYGPNHHLYSFGQRENRFGPRRFGYGPRSHRGDHFRRSPGFPAEWAHTHFEPRHLDDPRFPRRSLCHTRPNGEVEKIVKAFLGRMVKC
jgi:hypothetical protein